MVFFKLISFKIHKFFRVPLAENYKIIGCYAQTEMGHGSDVQNLETVADFDITKDEFILDSPSLTSTKMWPGDLGIYSTHAMVFAQLRIKGANHGVQPFLVPIRDVETHEILPGVDAGDIGPKFGYGTKDNGYLRLNKVRIPRENMLMKYSKVSKNGEFKIVGNEKVLYGIMLGVRLIIAGYSFRQMGYALTIAIRYSLLRTQFKDDNKAERKILDYQLQQEKLFPLLAQFYAMAFASQKIKKMVEENIVKVQANDFSFLNETHIALAGTKAYYTYTIFSGIERCRLSCGGHGFSHYSGLPALHQDFVPNCTLEGENTVMYLQVARFLLKMLSKVSKGQTLPGTFEYLNSGLQLLQEKCSAKTLAEISSLDTLRKLLIVNVSYLSTKAGETMLQNISEGQSMREAWDHKLGILLVEAARAHTIYFTFKCFSDGLRKIQDENLRSVMTNLCILYAVHEILDKPLGIIESEYISNEQFKMMQEVKENKFGEIRPHAIGLVDANMLSDNTLKSALGKTDGKVYETMFEWAQNENSFNKKPIADGMEYIFKMREVTPQAKL